MREQDFEATFEELVRGRRYVFHVHTDFTDGTSSVSEYCEVVLAAGFEQLVFTEHVRRECSYRFDDYIRAVERARVRYAPLKIGRGVEARLLPGGSLDIPAGVLERIDVLGIACHSFPPEPRLFVSSMKRAFQGYRECCPVVVWLHPGTFYTRLGIEDGAGYTYLLGEALANGLYVEENLKHGWLPAMVADAVPEARKVIGVDVHSVAELEEMIPRLLQRLQRRTR